VAARAEALGHADGADWAAEAAVAFWRSCPGGCHRLGADVRSESSESGIVLVLCNMNLPVRDSELEVVFDLEELSTRNSALART
jgi:hypothetical protein